MPIYYLPTTPAMPLSMDNFDEHEFSDVTNYRELSVIHQGRDSIVFLATETEPESKISANPKNDDIIYYAVKKITLGGTFSDILPRFSNMSTDIKRRFLYCEREIRTLRTLRGHPNVSGD